MRDMYQRILAVRSDDRVLHHVAPVGLAAAAGTAVVVDLDPAAPGYPGNTTVASLLEDGPRRTHLVPVRRGVAVFSSGGVTYREAKDLLETLVEGWPAAVLRVGPGETEVPVPVVPVIPLLPEPLTPRTESAAVYQAVRRGSRPPGPGLVLPPLGRGVLVSILAGRVEPRWRWIRAWTRVWGLPWR